MQACHGQRSHAVSDETLARCTHSEVRRRARRWRGPRCPRCPGSPHPSQQLLPASSCSWVLGSCPAALPLLLPPPPLLWTPPLLLLLPLCGQGAAAGRTSAAAARCSHRCCHQPPGGIRHGCSQAARAAAARGGPPASCSAAAGWQGASAWGMRLPGLQLHVRAGGSVEGEGFSSAAQDRHASRARPGVGRHSTGGCANLWG